MLLKYKTEIFIVKFVNLLIAQNSYKDDTLKKVM